MIFTIAIINLRYQIGFFAFLKLLASGINLIEIPCFQHLVWARTSAEVKCFISIAYSPENIRKISKKLRSPVTAK